MSNITPSRRALLIGAASCAASPVLIGSAAAAAVPAGTLMIGPVTNTVIANHTFDIEQWLAEKIAEKWVAEYRRLTPPGILS